MDKKDIRILKDGFIEIFGQLYTESFFEPMAGSLEKYESKYFHEIKPLPTDRYDDEFGEIAKEIQDEWDYSGLAGTVYEEFARECFNRYLRKL